MASIRKFMPEAGVSTDLMTGFCGETEEEHQETLSLMEEVKYDFAYMFAYSERPKTLAERKFEDDIPEEVKKRRLAEIIDLQALHSISSNESRVGKQVRVLIEGESKRSSEQFFGRSSQNAVVVFDREDFKKGDYVTVQITDSTRGTLLGSIVKA